MIRYAVVGLGHFAQTAILPAFAHAPNSRLTALVSGDPDKLKVMARKYGVKNLYGYEEYDACLESGEIDAVYLALPNGLHREYAVRAARKGIHVLCEKPMAVTERECKAMIRAAERGGVRLMIAYRLHLEEANLKAIQAVRKGGRLGEARIFSSLFTMQVSEKNFRLKPEQGGGSLYDIGIYCINAARYLFQAEPVEVTAFTASSNDPRFRKVDEMTSAILRFPGERLAAFTCSFGAADSGDYEIVGTKGVLRVEGGYDHVFGAKHILTRNEKKKRWASHKKDQLAAELVYFSRCILNGKNPESSGLEGLADVRIIRALYASARTRKPVKLKPIGIKARPRRSMQIDRPPVPKEPRVYHAHAPTRD